ncbi:type I restriction enzyme R subunit [Pullulanibacillus pueri]|uniref:Type I restriction enzyme endonuclease subunit n=1 Tax=Pullulanibacillus pueri TaxID=1437324 RepID=A0A8J2ZQH5_9BACL|nr:type I restriction endonuclease subunit R [Pullulanibacillus pueri]MBM7679881.1 type I restriction enzyme R subunit [Pullulanibacillus pueri]GGH73298.1 type I deoxyribonuclease HsdR [Pullulanibacillus pueri]
MTSTNEWNEKGLVENRIINHLRELGYEHIHGPSLDVERDSQGEIVLKARLANAIQRLNPWISDNNLNKVMRSITHMDATNIMEANQTFHDYLINMISVQQDLGKGRKSQTVRLLDFEDPTNNEFVVVDQFSITNAHGTIRPDVMIFINGLPLVVIECKSPTLSPDDQIGQGVKQLTRYQKDSESLFYYNQFMIVTSNDRAKAGTIGAKAQHYSEWKDPYPRAVAEIGDNPTPQDILVTGMLVKEQLLDLIQNFIVYEPIENKVIKKLARYQQFRAVRKAVDRILHAQDSRYRGGVVWHTQGSGKSLTMVFLAVKLRRIKELKNPTIVVVTDRKDLDDQISNTFRRCGFPNPQQAESVAKLKQLLQQGPGTTVTTLVQKFQEDAETNGYPELTKSENVFVMVDESHRTQYSSLAMNMRTGMPNACYLGFTGTPIDKEDKSTTRTFGTYIDKYTIEQAVQDGATVPIFYEARMVDLHVQGESLDDLFDRQFRDYSEEDRERIKKKYATEEAITASPKRIKSIVLDLIKHYEEHIKPNGFKAQIVAISREAAALYKEMLDELSDYESKVIISGGHNDEDNLKVHHLSKEEEKEVIRRFKQPMTEDALSFLIVCDKLLTGFDAPIEQVMYLDKPLKEHNLLQAIARTNRTYDKKSYGLIVDYYGVSRFLEEALGVFHKEDIKGALHDIDSEIPRLQSRHRKAMRFFDYINREDLEGCLNVLEPEDVRNEFETAFKKFGESMDRVLPSPKAQGYVKDLKHLGKILKLAKSRFREDGGADISDCGEKVKQLIEEHIYATTPSVLHEPIDILSTKFEQKLEELKTPEAKAAEMEHAIKHEIRIKLDENPVLYTSLKERLEELIQRRKDRQLTIEELLEEYREIMQQMRQNEQEGQAHGLSKQQYPFYQLLEKELEVTDEEALEALTEIITEIIQEQAVIEWNEKEDVKREMRKRIKKQLRASKCPSNRIENLTAQLMSLAEVHYRHII